MPLVRISLQEGTSPEYRKALADGVHRAMIESIAIASGDRFQVITQHPPGDLIYSPDYLGVSRSDRVVFVQITMSTGRKPQQKRALFKRMAEILSESPGLASRRTDSSLPFAAVADAVESTHAPADRCIHGFGNNIGNSGHRAISGRRHSPRLTSYDRS